MGNPQPNTSSSRFGDKGEDNDDVGFADDVSPIRDIVRFKDVVFPKEAVDPAEELFQIAPAPCGDIVFQVTSGPLAVKDPFKNLIKAIVQYGTDYREKYYIQYKTKNANSPIVVLIHGGAWFSGPNPANVNGFGLGYTPMNSPTTNIVKQLLNNGFIVVTVYYPLVAYGDNNTEILANTTTIQTQLNSIDKAILHIKNNFPANCFNVNANSIQILGESAGAHLALNWAYSSSYSTTVKSAVSLYCPTNMQHFGDFIKNKPLLYLCGGDYFYNPTVPNNNNTAHFPWYFPLPDFISPKVSYNSISFPNCFDPNLDPITYPNPRIFDTYKDIQSSYAEIINSPLSNTTLYNYSPVNVLNASKIIPTFIMHVLADRLVPYNQGTIGMEAKLTTTGGLYFNYITSGGTNIVPTNYIGMPKHGIKLYANGDHGFSTKPLSEIRGDIIKWLNGHK